MRSSFHQRVEIARRSETMGVGDGGSVGRRGAVAEPVPAGALKRAPSSSVARVDPGLEAVGVVERAGGERGVRDLQQVEEPVGARQWSW